MLPGMKPRSRPNVSPKQYFPGQPFPTTDDDEEEDIEEDASLALSEMVKRSSVRNLDMLRAAPEMLQLLQSTSENYKELIAAQIDTLEKTEHTHAHETKEDRVSTLLTSIHLLPSNVNDHAIRLIQFQPEWSILVFLRYLDVQVVAIENASFPYALGKSLPVLIHGNIVLSGRNAILEYLNQFNQSTSFNFYYSPMACYIESNCHQNLQYYNNLTNHTRIQSSILMSWGLKWAYSYIIKWWNQHSIGDSLLHGYQEQEILKRLDMTYQYLSNLIQPTSHHAHLNELSSTHTLPSEIDDGFQLADILLYGHMAEALLTSSDSVTKLLRKYPLLIEAFTIDSDRFFANCNSVRYL